MSQYKCNNCGRVQKSYFGLCPSCNEGLGEEIPDTPKSNAPAGTAVGSSGVALGINLGNEDYEVKRVSSDVKGVDMTVKMTKYSSLNEVLSSSGGFVKDQVIALGAMPGVGKSTLCTEISDNDFAYISTEESYNQINSRFNRTNPNTEADLIATTSLGSILKYIESTDKKVIVLDSLNSINNGADHYVKSARNMSLIVDKLKEYNKCGIIICQVTKSGEISGMNTVLHVVDTVLYLERSAVSSNLILYSQKNRFGEIGSISVFEHSPEGLVESQDDQVEEKTPGVVTSKAKFGFKNMDITVECLVAPAQGNFGLRKSNGVNNNRLIQILGILAYHDKKIDFSSKDVYISLRSGLSSNDYAIDLAIATAILSSNYNKYNDIQSQPVNGEISLSGYVRNGSAGIKHIKDLIEIYS
ncbi:hypothetical protein [Enterococcus sp. AZ180]|uniref:hypothetical protein n=1 Tax=Enterococcus sp. AZ180 TaxID=2774961 RepID=UPI003F273974